MIIFKEIDALRRHLGKRRQHGKIGFVPTMGALHEGHLTLIRAAKQQTPTVVASIFVNPAQFNDPRDFQKYPITIEKDIQMLIAEGCDLLFLPGIDEIYPQGYQTTENYDLGILDQILEGKFRPGHFQGVCRVVNRLLNIVEPDCLFLGQKDYQQCMVIRTLITLTDRKTAIEICPTMRETDGLAMSSRNMRLTEEDRKKAPALFQALCYAKEHLQPGPLQPVISTVENNIEASGFKLDYFSIADAASLQNRDEWDGEQKLVAVVAAFLGDVRLIDNMLLN